jgi:hypothetical protein
MVIIGLWYGDCEALCSCESTGISTRTCSEVGQLWCCGYEPPYRNMTR